jgi:hypothetical protein
MKATEPGRVIGIALEPYNGEGIGKIMVFVNPHWSIGQISEEGLIYTEEGIRQKEIQPASILDQFTLAIKKSLEKLGLILQGGIAKIEKLLTKEIETGKITTKQICLEGDDGETICIDKNQLKELLQQRTNNQQILNNQTTNNEATNNQTANDNVSSSVSTTTPSTTASSTESSTASTTTSSTSPQ